jgi:hypothetical protein
VIYYGNVIFKGVGKKYLGKFNKIKWATTNISHQAIFYPRQNSKIMYSSEDLERFYFQYQTEGLPHGESLQSFCVKNKVPSKGEGTKLSAYELLSFYLNRL